MLHQFFLINLVNLFIKVKGQLGIFEHGFTLARASQIYEEEASLSGSSKQLLRFGVSVGYQLTERDAWKIGYGDIVGERWVSVEVLGRWHVYKTSPR